MNAPKDLVSGIGKLLQEILENNRLPIFKYLYENKVITKAVYDAVVKRHQK